jgi:hypothetical protein
MKDSKLLEILNTLTAEETQSIPAFLDFSLLNAAYDVTADDIKRLWHVLQTLRTNFNDVELDPNLVYKMVFPKKNVVKGRLEKTMSALLKEIEKLISYRFYTEGGLLPSDDAFTKQFSLLKFYSDRQLKSRFERTVEKMKADCAGEACKDPDSFLKSYYIEVADYEYQSYYSTQKGDVNLRSTLDSLDLFYVVSQLNHLTSIISKNQRMSFDITKHLELLDDLESIIRKKQLEKMPVIETYWATIQMLLEKINFDEFQATLNRNETFFTLAQRKRLRTIERNKCVELFNTGQKEYVFILSQLLEKHLDAGYLYYESGLKPSTLLNLTAVAVRVKNFSWIKKVLDTHRNRIISADDAEQVFRLNYAAYHFGKGEYKAASDHISNDYKFKDLYYDLTKRRLEIKILYEQKEGDLCTAHNEAFKNYLFTRTKKKKEDNFPTITFEPNNNFVNFITALLNLTKSDKVKIKHFYEKLMETPAVADQDWFLEKVLLLLPSLGQ